MNVLVDTNVWLDIFLVREPFARTSGRVVSLLDSPSHELFAGATTVTTIFYLIEKEKGRATARRKIRAMLDRCRVAAVGGDVLRGAVEADFEDFEDAVLDGAADAAGLEAIVTRNPSDFRRSTLRIYTPEEFVAADDM